jgi:hypothetical protein
MTADAIQEFLHEKQMPLLVENGGVPLYCFEDCRMS